MAAELKLLKTSEKFNDILEVLTFQNFIINKINEFSNDMIIVLNSKKRIISCSEKFLKFSPKINIIGENFFNIINDIIQLPDDFFYEKSYFVKVTNTNTVLKAEIIKYYVDDNINRYIIILKDITNQKELQAQKDNFIATLTHDLKTPVRANILSLELLLNNRFGELNSQQKEIISEILNSNKFTMSMLDTLLAKYKYESNGVELHITNFMLNDFIKDCVNDLKCLFNEQNITCIYNLKNDINIEADKIELKRAFLNILSNAIKFNNPNGKVEIETSINDEIINIIVKDTGIGMSNDKLQHIFDKYVSYAKKFRRLGTGLGLYVAKKIIESHNGKIIVKSIPDKGSTFTISLPLKNNL